MLKLEKLLAPFGSGDAGRRREHTSLLRTPRRAMESDDDEEEWAHLRRRRKPDRPKLFSRLRVLVAAALLLIMISWRKSTAVPHERTRRSSCPALRATTKADSSLVRTLGSLWPDRRPELDAHPAVYAARADARQQLGPLFWADVHDGIDSCVLVIMDGTLAERLFADDGVALHRHFDMQTSKGLKFAVGADWKRQRSILTKHVLTDAGKMARADAAAPEAAACLVSKLRANTTTSIVDLMPPLRECLAVFFVTAVMGSRGWPKEDRSHMARRMVECEGTGCNGREGGPRESTFECLRRPMEREVDRRIGAYGAGSAAAADPDADSLLGRMLQRVDGGGGLLREEVVTNAISFLSAGWETSTLTMVNTLWLLLQKEYHHAVHSDSQLAARALDETLRWRPPIPWHGGTTVKPLVADAKVGPNGSSSSTYEIPKGTRMIVDIIGTHELPREGLFGPRGGVSRWDPRRNGDALPLHAGGVGARHCPGGAMAKRGMAALLGELMRAFPKLALAASAAEVHRWLQGYRAEVGSDICELLYRQSLPVRREGLL